MCYIFTCNSENQSVFIQHSECRVRLMLFNATFNNFSVTSYQSVLLVEETWIPGEHHRPVTRHWQTLSQCCIEYISPWAGFVLITLVVIGTDCTGSCKSKLPYDHDPEYPTTFWGDQLCSLRAVCNPLEINKALN
jgi:hypothetical protein